MPSISFKIGDAFPADDPVARFMTIVAMISNDWQRLAQRMVELDDAECAHEDARAEQAALLIENYRLQGALHYEAARCLKLAYERFGEIRTFVDGLPAEAIDEYRLGRETSRPPSRSRCCFGATGTRSGSLIGSWPRGRLCGSLVGSGIVGRGASWIGLAKRGDVLAERLEADQRSAPITARVTWDLRCQRGRLRNARVGDVAWTLRIRSCSTARWSTAWISSGATTSWASF